MKQFKVLTKSELKDIYLSFLAEEPKLHIARRLGVDNSTVHYHINRLKNKSYEQIIALIEPRDYCHEHTALKCLVCGRIHDNIKSDEYQEIIRLKRRVLELEKQLYPNDENVDISTNSTGRKPIVVTIIG
jgi:hypothetical protein